LALTFQVAGTFVQGRSEAEAAAITAEDVAEVVAFAVSRPRNVSLNEILVRPTGQAL